jgi:hypothetical protein
MKKSLMILVTLVLVFGMASLALAATTIAPTVTKPKPKSFSGTVDSITLADAAKGIKPQITVIGSDKAKTKMTFLVTDTTTIYAGKDKKTLDKIKVKDKVKVRYIVTKEGANEAQSIKVVTK